MTDRYHQGDGARGRHLAPGRANDGGGAVSDDNTPRRLIVSIESAVGNIQRLCEHFEYVAGEADCRPAAAERGETGCAMALQAGAHACIAALAEKAHTTTHKLHDAIAESRTGERDDEAPDASQTRSGRGKHPDGSDDC